MHKPYFATNLNSSCFPKTTVPTKYVKILKIHVSLEHNNFYFKQFRYIKCLMNYKENSFWLCNMIPAVCLIIQWCLQQICQIN